MQVILDSFFSPARVQHLYGAGRKESSGTGLGIFMCSTLVSCIHYAPINGLPQDGGGRATQGKFDIFRFSNVNFPTLGSPL